MGSTVAYKGDLRFARERSLEHGIGKIIKISLAGEGFSLIKAEGRGKLYLADRRKKVSVLKLVNDSICVNCNDILAIEDSLKWDLRMMRKLSGIVESDIYSVKLEGTGMVAITTNQDPLTFRVTKECPVFTSPNATVAWSGDLEPEVKKRSLPQNSHWKKRWRVRPGGFQRRRLCSNTALRRGLLPGAARKNSFERKCLQLTSQDLYY
jgi:uncharacterized protein (AIM24 family)